jgi:hypothetical protein
MKTLFKITLVFVTTLLVSCKKDYACTAKYGSEEKVFNCENCSSSDVDAYKKKITEKGWTDVSCDKQ